MFATFPISFISFLGTKTLDSETIEVEMLRLFQKKISSFFLPYIWAFKLRFEKILLLKDHSMLLQTKWSEEMSIWPMLDLRGLQCCQIDPRIIRYVQWHSKLQSFSISLSRIDASIFDSELQLKFDIEYIQWTVESTQSGS